MVLELNEVGLGAVVKLDEVEREIVPERDEGGREMVLELDEVDCLHSYLVGQLVLLHKRLSTHDGMLRLAGVSDHNQNVLRACRLESRFPQYANRTDAVHGHRPPQPR